MSTLVVNVFSFSSNVYSSAYLRLNLRFTPVTLTVVNKFGCLGLIFLICNFASLGSKSKALRK